MTYTVLSKPERYHSQSRECFRRQMYWERLAGKAQNASAKYLQQMDNLFDFEAGYFDGGQRRRDEGRPNSVKSAIRSAAKRPSPRWQAQE